MKNIIKIIIIILIFNIINIYDVVAKTNNKYVIGNNNLDKDTIEYINTYSKFLYDNTNFSYYIVVNDSKKIYNDDDSNKVYDKYIESEDGLVIIYYQKINAVKVVAGKNISNIINDEVVDNNIKKYILTYFSTSNIDEGIINGYNSFYKIICDKYNIDSSNMTIESKNNFINNFKLPILLIITWIISILSSFYNSFYKNIKNNKINTIDYIIFSIIIFINILLLYLSYILDNLSIIIIITIEIISILNTFNRSKKSKHIM